MRATLLLPMAVALVPTSAGSAPTRDPAGAQALFNEASAAMQKQPEDWATACPKFVASEALDPSGSVSTLINIARCEEHDGRVASAWSTFESARTLNLYRDDSPARRAGLAESIDVGQAKIAARVSRVAISVSPEPEGLVVTRDGVSVPTAALGSMLPVNAGTIAIRATAPGYRASEDTFHLGEATSVLVHLDLEPLSRPQHAEPRAPPPEPAPLEWRMPTTLLAGWTLVGAGGALVAAAAATGIASGVQVAMSADECAAAVCTPTGFELRKQAGALEIAAWSMAGAAVTAAAIGIPLIVLGKHKPQISLHVGPSWAGLDATF